MMSGLTFSLATILKRQDGLEAPIAALLGRTSGRVTLDDEQLALRRVALLAVGQLARKRQSIEDALSNDQVARLPRGLPGAGRGQALLDDPPAVGRVLLEVLDQAVRHGRLDLALDLGVAELRLRLALELRIGELDADHRREALADVVAGQVRVGILEHAGLARPVIERTCQGGPETGDVGAAIHRVDVVGEREHVLRVGVVVLEGNLDGSRTFPSLDVDRSGVEGLLVAVEVADKRLEATLEIERSLAVDPFVDERDPDALREVSRFAQPLRNGVEGVLDGLEHLGIRVEDRPRAASVALRSDLLDRPGRLAANVLLGPDGPIAGRFHAQVIG